MSNLLDAKTAHGRLCQALIALRKAEGNAVTLFAEILRRRLFRELGFATIHLYASEALGFSRTKCYEFIRLSESIDQLPQLKAGKKSRRELERQVAASRAKRDRPQREREQILLMALEAMLCEKEDPSRRDSSLDNSSTRVACGSTNFLEVHHRQARSAGGGNGEENLITLCASCHRHLHERGSSARWLRDAEER